MKKVFFILIAGSLTVGACKNNEAAENVSTFEANEKIIADTTTYTSIQWLDSLVNVGNIKEGEQATVKFRFRNTGERPLYIISVAASCGCTVPDYTKGAVAPGGTGEITGQFNSKGFSGEVHKTITVVANTTPSNNHVVAFTANVK